MKFDWKLQPLQRKLEWDLDLARGRVAAARLRFEQAGDAVRGLEEIHAAQAAAALAATRRGADPALHKQALAWLLSAETRLLHRRTECTRAKAELAAARTECRRCNERLEALSALHDEAQVRFAYAERREAGKEADFAWLASRSAQEPA
ncbi:hypothetical protein LZ009_19420 [Ramlibacter sp. XY19]|uniref:hypothetical protein n=1 Tax=Ramlibacter paludis TaxID=2908000 RepID=UPI0023DBF0D9|nr:hypothetical protein [Ramlibacter paludis]MCG2594954.1 hypothetical protein [Ramlibacter paludis]